MKIFWFINTLFPEFAESIGREKTVYGGWIYQFKERLSMDKELELVICSVDVETKTVIKKEIRGVTYYLFPRSKKQIHIYDSKLEKYIERVLAQEKPDLVHIWGTEYPHTLSVCKTCKNLNIENIVSIQGIISDCSKHYLDELDFRTIYGFSLRDFLRKDNIYFQMKKFEKRGEYEKKTIKIIDNVIGRTSYDYALVKEINPQIEYYSCNECLRPIFYEEKWDMKFIERNSIFISQASYPIKGFHIFLEGLKYVKDFYPNVKVYVAGGFNPMSESWKDKLSMGNYAKHIKNRIKKYKLEKNIEFVGNLSEEVMKAYMLKSHVFVSPSVVENSSNSIGEAMLLGVPTVSSYVGGVRDMISDKKTGFCYPANQPDMMARMIMDYFENDELANEISKKSRMEAKKLFDVDINTNEMKRIYKKVNSHKNI